MNCTKLLHVLGSSPQPSVMPAALSLCRSEPLYHLLGMSPTLTIMQPFNQSRGCTLTRVNPHPTSSSSSERQGCFRRDSTGLKKKRVVFADAIGLALTAVRFFIPEVPYPTLVASPSPTQIVSPSPTLKFFTTPSSPTRAQVQQWPSLGSQVSTLGLPAPIVNSKAYSASPLEDLVQLESCSISERSLSGTVRVCHVGLKKAVYLRVTWNSWRSHHDFPCTPLPQGQETDLFAFDVSLPPNLDPDERLEFFVFSRTGSGSAARWDNNGGQTPGAGGESDGSRTFQKSLSRRGPSRTLHRPGAGSRGKKYTDISDMLVSQSSGRL